MKLKNKKKYTNLLSVLFVLIMVSNFFVISVISSTEITDPYIYCTYFGGSQNDIIEEIQLDEEGNYIVVGDTFSEDLIVLNAYQSSYGGGIQPDIHSNGGDGFIVKYAKNNSLLWSTYFGGSLLDEITGIIIDNEGDIVITGNTQSSDFPVTENALQTNYSGGNSEVFLSKFAQNGSLLYSTYFGGTGDDIVAGIDIDTHGCVYIAGTTSSSNLNTTLNATQQEFGGIYDSFLTKFDSNLSKILYSSYIGSTDADISYNINLDSHNNVIITGVTMGENFPLNNSIVSEKQGDERDMFIYKLDSMGSIVFSTYWGGSQFEDPFGATIDSLGNIIVSGRTASNDYTTSNAFQSQFGGEVDGSIMKLTEDGQEVIFSSYWGGTSWETLHHVATNSNNSIYVAGIGSQNNLLLREFQSSSAGGSDLVLMKIDSTGELQFSSYYGGSDSETPFDIKYSNNTIMVVGSTRSESNFVSDDAYQINSNGENEGFILFFDIEDYLAATPYPVPSNLPLILGLTLPIVVVGIPVTIYIFRKKNNK